MQLSSDPSYPGYEEWVRRHRHEGEYFEVYVDGRLVPYAIACDDVEGIVIAVEHDEKGPLLDKTRTVMLHKTIRGQVRVEARKT